MSIKHEFKCDKCKRKALANYNGEHYLPPRGWVKMYDENLADMLNYHLCDRCKPGSIFKFKPSKNLKIKGNKK